MALDGTLKHWHNGEPTIPDESLTAFKYWNDGEPYTIIKEAGVPPVGVAPTSVFIGPFGGPFGGPIQ